MRASKTSIYIYSYPFVSISNFSSLPFIKTLITSFQKTPHLCSIIVQNHHQKIFVQQFILNQSPQPPFRIHVLSDLLCSLNALNSSSLQELSHLFFLGFLNPPATQYESLITLIKHAKTASFLLHYRPNHPHYYALHPFYAWLTSLPFNIREISSLPTTPSPLKLLQSTVISAHSSKQEILNLVAEIKKLKRKKIPFNNICIIVPHLQYINLMKPLFNLFGIPINFSQHNSLITLPLTQFLLTFFEFSISNYSAPSFEALLQYPFTQLLLKKSFPNIFINQNIFHNLIKDYHINSGINSWKKAFRQKLALINTSTLDEHPRTYLNNQKILQQTHLLRQQKEILLFFIHKAQNFSSCQTPSSLALFLNNLLTELNLSSHFSKYKLPQAHFDSYQALIHAINRFPRLHQASPNQTKKNFFTLKKLQKLFTQHLEHSFLPPTKQPPSGLLVLQKNEYYYAHRPIVFLCGLTEGIWPHQFKGTSYTPGLKNQPYHLDKHLFFNLLYQQPQQIYFSFFINKNKSVPSPSHFLSEAALLLPKKQAFSLLTPSHNQTTSDIFLYQARLLTKTPTPNTTTTSHSDTKPLSSINLLTKPLVLKNISTRYQKPFLSITELENYYLCPYKYLLKHVFPLNSMAFSFNPHTSIWLHLLQKILAYLLPHALSSASSLSPSSKLSIKQACQKIFQSLNLPNDYYWQQKWQYLFGSPLSPGLIVALLDLPLNFSAADIYKTNYSFFTPLVHPSMPALKQPISLTLYGQFDLVLKTAPNALLLVDLSLTQNPQTSTPLRNFSNLALPLKLLCAQSTFKSYSSFTLMLLAHQKHHHFTKHCLSFYSLPSESSPNKLIKTLPPFLAYAPLIYNLSKNLKNTIYNMQTSIFHQNSPACQQHKTCSACPFVSICHYEKTH
jgi:hypothetical protein